MPTYFELTAQQNQVQIQQLSLLNMQVRQQQQAAAFQANISQALFETEKVLYELRYELGSRPDWTWIPLAGLADLLSARPA